MISIGITDHVEGPLQRPSLEIYREISDLVDCADRLGVKYAWFAEHHAHIHEGHLPTPLLLALHLAGRTQQIQLGTAIICLNLHPPVDIAEQAAVADLLTAGRMAIGFGSGSTPEESALFGIEEISEEKRHARFEDSLRQVLIAWGSRTNRDEPDSPASNFSLRDDQLRDGPSLLPLPPSDLPSRCWLACNSVGAARIAGRLNFNMLFSHLRTPADYAAFSNAYRESGGRRLIAANRPVYVGRDDDSAFADAEPALRILWRRFQKEGKIPATAIEPSSPRDLCGHPLNFIVGAPATVAAKLTQLRRDVHYDVINIEVRWEGLPHAAVLDSLRRFVLEAAPRI